MHAAQTKSIFSKITQNGGGNFFFVEISRIIFKTLLCRRGASYLFVLYLKWGMGQASEFSIASSDKRFETEKSFVMLSLVVKVP